MSTQVRLSRVRVPDQVLVHGQTSREEGVDDEQRRIAFNVAKRDEGVACQVDSVFQPLTHVCEARSHDFASVADPVERRELIVTLNHGLLQHGELECKSGKADEL